MAILLVVTIGVARATEINSSGVWNTSYLIDTNNIDHYPIVPEFPSPLPDPYQSR